MKKTSAFVAALMVAGSVSAAFAGGPVIVAAEPEPAPPVLAPVSSFGPGATALAVIGGVAVIAAIASNNDSSTSTTAAQ
ncbi:hypothetical protein [Ruixingdingia sedimenti]|uniref:Uncharacterized protein n=1 Tax=Ruixingdingia sedimenti TaxID=3073604 RepID=A0ABU1F682_9RHOB|nr:hypothetical protein [Xinfangfangia sp. LG-4]MDR5652384.1 hypothetical protein [Xinfangfangia sp. LG-4]